MDSDKIVEQIFSKKKLSLREMIRQAIADLPQPHQKIARNRFKDIQFCVGALVNNAQFPASDAIAATIKAIDFNDPSFKFNPRAIAASSPKRYAVDPLPE